MISIVDGNAQKTGWVKKKRWTPGRPSRVRGIVIHTSETPEIKRGAINVAAWFSHPAAPSASAHYAVDDGLIVRCVADEDTAWHCGSVNPWTIGIELQGRAGQSTSDWSDDYSRRMLALAADLVADLCSRYAIPVVHLLPEQLRADDGSATGIFGHGDHTTAFHVKGGHTDPGPNFPWDLFLADVLAKMS